MGRWRRFKTEYLVNTTTLGNQGASDVALIGNDRYVVTWRDTGQGGRDTDAIRAQIYNSDGTRIGTEFLVNTTTTGYQLSPSATGLSNGKIVITWHDNAARGQIFNADGSKFGQEFTAGQRKGSGQSGTDVTALSNNRFIITYTDFTGQDGDLQAVRAQIFDNNGTALGAEFRLNTITRGDQIQCSITALEGGGFVATWVNRYSFGPATASAQVFAADGTRVGGQFDIAAQVSTLHKVSVTGLSGGNFVVTWSDQSRTAGDTSNDAMKGQIFSNSGTKVGGEFLVNTTTANHQHDSSIVSLGDGRFVVTWTDASSRAEDTSLTSIRAQVFAADGTKSGTEFVVNTTTRFQQENSSVASLGDGRFVVSWSDYSGTGGDTDDFSIRSQIFDSKFYDGDGTAETVIGGSFADSIFGAGGNDTISGAAGRDTLDGGTGNDLLTGGAGNDTFVFNASMGSDTITAFDDTATTNDVLQFSRSLVSSFDALRSKATQVGTDVVINISATDKLTIQKMSLVNLGADDCVFL